MTSEMRRFGRIRWCLAAVLTLALWPAAARAQSDTVVYYYADAVGTVRMTTDGSGTVLERYDDPPFGVPAETPPAGEPRRFAGKERDAETGLDYFGARFYSSQTGRFTTVDPVMNVEGSLVDPQRWNRYAYARNSPLVFIDPDGREVLRAVTGWEQRLMQVAGSIRAQVATALGADSPVPQHPLGVLGRNVVDTLLGTFLPRNVDEYASGASAAALGMAAPLELPSKAAARAAFAELGEVGAAVNRFFRGATSKSTGFKIGDLQHGARQLEFFSPARSAGYGKRYVQVIDESGRVVREFKETIGPNGIIEVKWLHGGPE